MLNCLKALFFIIILSCVKCSPKQEIRNNTQVKKKSDVRFLTINEGALAILDETYEPYFSNLQIREIHTLTGVLPPTKNIDSARTFAREKFSSAVTAFTKKEQTILQHVISVVKDTFERNNLNIIANHPWKLIKIEDWLCGGFAHTRGDYIILSQRHLNHLTSFWSEKMSHTDSVLIVKKLGSLLAHEQFHSLQRKYPKKFESLYVESWDFKKAHIEIDSAIIINQLTNPDAPKAEWITNRNGNYYWARTLINEHSINPKMGEDFIDVVFTLNQNGNHFSIAKDTLNNPKTQRLFELTSYTNSFPVTQGLDHPNEISAYMFSKYFEALIERRKPFDNTTKKATLFSQKYLTWIKNNF